MKTIYTYVSLLFSAMIVLGSCTDDTDFQGVQSEKAEFVTLNLNYESQNDKEVIVSRSAATLAEKKLYDLHFYVFDVNGNLTGYEEVLPIGDSDVIEEADQTEKVSIRAKSGESYIYAVANINESTTYYLDNDDLALLNIDKGTTDEEYRRNIETSELDLQKFLSIQFKRLYGGENKLFSPDPADNVFVMSGYINDGRSVNIPQGTNGITSLPAGQNVVKLYRILAKSIFTITSGTTKGKFTPKYYRLCNVPTEGALIPNTGISTSMTYLKNNVTDAKVESSFQWNFEGMEAIAFYYPENLQVAKNKIVHWKDREKNLWNGNIKTFTNAADKAAYIEIYGDYEDASGDITANVNYTIHFGDFSSTGSLTDFNVIRNHTYKYKVTIDGVDDIMVEAQTTTGEDNPYAEGMIVDASVGKHFDVDAHYEARVMAFNKKTIQDLKKIGSGYILNIKTPFGETKETVNVKTDGVYRMDGAPLCSLDKVSSLFKNDADYQWIKFVKNTKDNLTGGTDISKFTCKYPGDTSDDCLNVFELLAQLYDESNYPANGEVYYTCFIDENYYANKSWTEYVDKEPRNMLIANDLDVSADGKSLYAKVAYSISQRSITTFYTTNYADKKAFGSEIIDEEDVYGSRFDNDDYNTKNAPIKGMNDWNAWTSASVTNNGVDWSDDTKAIEGIQPLYATVAKACMSRNRDLNGSGEIEENEVRWYLAAVDQYRALFFGQNALNADAYLINRDELAEINKAYNGNWQSDENGHKYRSKYHYFTSSGGDKATFWPEEGLTNNPTNISWSFAQLVRCIRTLESDGEGLQDPEPFYTYGNNTFNLDGIVATRNYTEASLSEHNEVEPSNNLYSSFVVAKNDLINPRPSFKDSYLFAMIDVVTGDDLCRSYSKQEGVGADETAYTWRTPNQKEFALMVSKMNNHRYGTRTKFSASEQAYGNKDYWHKTSIGHWSDSGGGGRINVGAGYEDGVRVRCVRDKK